MRRIPSLFSRSSQFVRPSKRHVYEVFCLVSLRHTLQMKLDAAYIDIACLAFQLVSSLSFAVWGIKWKIFACCLDVLRAVRTSAFSLWGTLSWWLRFFLVTSCSVETAVASVAHCTLLQATKCGTGFLTQGHPLFPLRVCSAKVLRVRKPVSLFVTCKQDEADHFEFQNI